MRKFFLGLFFLTNCFISRSQNIEIGGNGFVIPGDGSNVPLEADGTYFGDVPIKSVKTNVFSITSLESGNPGIQIQNISVSSPEFMVTHKLRHLGPGEKVFFEVTMKPVFEGFMSATVYIEVKRRNQIKTYAFNLRGRGTKEIMISQYYESPDADWIELKSLTNQTIGDGKYFVGVYSNGSNLADAPDAIMTVGQLNDSEVRLLGGFDMYDGNDIIVVSTSNGVDFFDNRVDIIGTHQNFWGTSIAYGKGGCSSETSHDGFDILDWTEIPVSKVDEASDLQNIALGTYQLGPISWEVNQWTGNALPDLSRKTYIQDNYNSILGSIETCDLIINGLLDFDEGGKSSVVVYGDLTINGGFIIGDGESLVMYDDQASIIGNIIKKESSTHRNSAHDFTYWSSPVSNGQIANVFQGVRPDRIFYYDQSKTSSSDPSAPDYWNAWVNASGNLAPGKGYAAEGLSGTIGVHHIEFNGPPNSGAILEDIYFWNDADVDNDFNLIGNPYPSAIDIEAFFDANNRIVDPTIYLWTHSTEISNGDSGDFSSSDYATYNYTGGTGVGSAVGDGPIPDKNIGSAQGFFIRAISSGQVVFNNAMRMEDANDQFFKRSGNKVMDKSSEKDRIWLNLSTDHGGFNQLLIGFMDKATTGFDRGYDAIKLGGSNKIEFYSVVADQKLAIQGLGSFMPEQEIVLGFDSQVVDRVFTISIAKTEGVLKESGIYLVDNLLGVTHNLKESDYVFEQVAAGTYKDRFNLKFIQEATLSVDHISDEKGLWIYNNDNIFTIKSPKVVKSVRVFDVLGKLIMETYPDASSFELNESQTRKGELLIMHLMLENHVLLSKKLIKQ